MKEHKTSDELIITAEKYNPNVLAVQITLLGATLLSFYLLYDTIESYFSSGDTSTLYFIVLWSSFILFFGYWSITLWIISYHKLIMNKDGVSFQFYNYERFFRWEELIVRRYIVGKGGMEIGTKNGPSFYYDGIFFSDKPIDFFSTFRPFSCIFVNFYPYGISKGNGDYSSQVAARKAFKQSNHAPEDRPPRITRMPEFYAVDKAEFLSYMDMWNVKIDGLTTAARELYAEEVLEEGKFHP